MATDNTPSNESDPEIGSRLAENLKRLEALSVRFAGALARKKTHSPRLDGPDPSVFAHAVTAYWAEVRDNPTKVLEHQIEFWSESVRHFVAAQQALASGKMVAPEDHTPQDPRFSNPLWSTHPFFNFVKQQYLINAEAIRTAVNDIEDMDQVDKRRLIFFSNQIIDMMAPTNFLATNPDALEKAVATEGRSLVDGLENLVRDLEANDGELVVRLADESAFSLGQNIATSKGHVVYRNRMMELVQYAPSTETVRKTPLVLFPPWINKFYILDLKERNSLVRWIVDQGYTLFVVSWVNPNEEMAEVGLEDYVEDGYLTAIRTVKAICDVPSVNVVGYCIGGTTLALTLSLLRQRGEEWVNSATFLTTLMDFSDQGEFTPFLQDDFVDAIESEIRQSGILPSHIMARTFSFLRPNDLVYGPAIRNYMMGETPPAFDLLFWNGDGTNLPGKMAIQYLRGLCQRNEFAGEGFDLLGHRLKIEDVEIPLCAVACETDHIAPWKDSYRGIVRTGSRQKTFILTQSGHIAGIINPPTKKKYGHYTNPEPISEPGEWLATAAFREGSWWPCWEKWLAGRSGDPVEPPVQGGGVCSPLCEAPGTYVLCKPGETAPI